MAGYPVNFTNSLVSVRNRNGDFRSRLERESMPLNGIYATKSGAYSNTALLGSYPGATSSWWIDTLQVTANQACSFNLQSGGGFFPSIGWYMPYQVAAGQMLNIPLNAYLAEGSGLTLTLSNSGGDANFYFTAALQGKILSADCLREDADCILLSIGDSVGSGAGISFTEQNYLYQLRDYLIGATGRNWRVIRKSMGGMTSTHQESLRSVGKLDVMQPHLVVYNLGMNDASASAFSPNLDAMTTYLNRQYPSAVKIFCGPTLRVDSQENILTSIRSYISQKVSGLGGRNVYANLGNLWTSSQQSTNVNADGIHPNPVGHPIMSNYIISLLTANANSLLSYLTGLYYQ